MSDDSKRAEGLARMAYAMVASLFDRLAASGLVDESALAEAEHDAIGLVATYLSGLDFQDIWREFLSTSVTKTGRVQHCGLCGNHGIVDTMKSNVRTPAGWPVGIQAYCVCPNGRAMKHGVGLAPGTSSVIAPLRVPTPQGECGRDCGPAYENLRCRRPQGHGGDCSYYPHPGEPGSPWSQNGKATGPFPDFGQPWEDD